MQFALVFCKAEKPYVPANWSGGHKNMWCIPESHRGRFRPVRSTSCHTLQTAVRITGCLTDQQVWFPGVSGKHFDENSVEFEVFKTVNFNLNEEACGDRPHPTPISVTQPSLTVTVTAEYKTRCFYW